MHITKASNNDDISKINNLNDNHLSIMKHETILSIIGTYFKDNGYLNYNTKCDPFINIISEYIIEKSIKINNNNEYIDLYEYDHDYEFDETLYVGLMDIIDKDFIAIAEPTEKQLLSL